MQMTKMTLKNSENCRKTAFLFSHYVHIARRSAPATNFSKMTSKIAIFKSCHRVPRNASPAQETQQASIHLYIATIIRLCYKPNTLD